VECDVGMFRKIPAIQAYIESRRHKALQIKIHKLMIDYSQTSPANFVTVVIVDFIFVSLLSRI
jgi:hypothetical protein